MLVLFAICRCEVNLLPLVCTPMWCGVAGKEEVRVLPLNWVVKPFKEGN